MSSVDELTTLIKAKAAEIVALKAAKASKEEIMPKVTELLALKESFKAANGGVPFDPPKETPKKKEKVVPPQPPKDDSVGPSKKELNKLAKKANKKAATAEVKDGVAGGGAGDSAAAAAGAPAATAAASTATATATATGPTPEAVWVHPTSPADMSRLMAAATKSVVPFINATIPLPGEEKTKAAPHQPYLTCKGSGDKVCGDVAIASYLADVDGMGGRSVWARAQVTAWVTASASASADELKAMAESALATRTYLVGESMSLADVAVYVALCGGPSKTGASGVGKKDKKDKKGAAAAGAAPAPAAATSAFFAAPDSKYPSLSRWALTVGGRLPVGAGDPALPPVSPPSVLATAAATATSTAPGKKGGAAKGGGKAADGDKNNEGPPPLFEAKEGQVVTRFPPEPSGYLHLGHCKAVLLNDYYAKRYKGKLIVRFDDTNPSKEKQEYADNILKDLNTLGVKPHQVTHSSDSFSICEDYARKLIADGLAFMDDTDAEKMTEERSTRTPSYRRDSSVKDNLALFERLLVGDKEVTKFCMRAKIDMTSVNGTLRDPVMYRYNALPHIRTGTKHCAYPTYGFACPIIDSIEGVTHALRTTEYNDQNVQYNWLQTAMKLRPVHIETFGKVNFIHTVLSKRKLNWFVENKLVEGWFDPRFPTIQGCIRRGVDVEALRAFIYAQGASKRIITMEWDKFWSQNKMFLEHKASRFMGICKDTAVPVLVSNFATPGITEVTETQVHPSRPELGTRVMRRSERLLIEQDDCSLFKEGDIVTMLRWGNFRIDKVSTAAADGRVTEVTATYLPESTDYKKTKKLTWLADVEDNIMATLTEYDHLISKPKLEDTDEFQNFLTPVTVGTMPAVVDACLRLVPAGQVVQLERRGFYRVDKAYGGPASPMVLINVPDGRTKAMSTLSSALVHR